MYSLAPYVVRVMDSSNGKYLDLSTLSGTTKKPLSLLDILNAKATNLSNGNAIDFPDSKKVVRFNKPYFSNGHFYGITEVGEYGYTQDIIDPHNSTVAYKKPKNQAGVIPFYYHLIQTNKPDVALMTCQKFRTFGIKTHLSQLFGAHICTVHPTWSLRIERIVPSALIEKMLKEGDVKTLRFISHSNPSDIADDLPKLTPDNETDSIELVIKARRNKNFGDAILGAFKAKTPIKDLVVFPNFEYETVKIEIEFAGRRRIIDLGSPSRLAGLIEITDDLSFQANGHPTISSLKAASSDLMNQLAKQV